jgi:molybdopterin converting factor small subunit
MTQTITVTVHIPTALRAYCRGASHFPLSAPDVRSMLATLEREYPRLYPNICDETGAVRRHLNIFVNTASIRDGQGLDTVLAPGDVVTILTAVSGG